LAVQLQQSAETTSASGRSLSFNDLSIELKAQRSVPPLNHLYQLVERTKISPDELRPYLGFKTGNYSRHRVMKNEFVEMLVLCWKPGQRTPIHDSERGRESVLHLLRRSTE
jgi:hypothetical protein